ncbi:MAG: protein translocase subunit SecD [Candidatus Falkowbacteria bacterium]|nr:protein translocase subunit SecD [Candidatus Falkowbacteria bacterium]
MSDSIFSKIFLPKGRNKVWWAFLFVLIITIAAGLVTFGNYYNQALSKWKIPLPQTKEVPFRLGLDLQGGSQLVYDADVSAVAAKDQAQAVEGARDVIERRVNVFGVSEPLVQVNRTADGKYRILVELAGITDIREAVKKIGETPLLEFKEQRKDAPVLTEQQKKEIADFNKKAETKAQDVLGKLLSGGDFSALAKAFSEDTTTKDNGGSLDWVAKKDNADLAKAAEAVGVGKTSKDLIKTSEGFELLKVDDKRIKEVRASHILICYKGSEQCTNDLSKEQAYAKIKELKAKATPKNFADLAKANSTEAAAKTTGGDLDWFAKGAMVEPFEKAVWDQKVGTISYVVETKFGYHIIYKTDENPEYKINHILIKTKSEAEVLGTDAQWKNTELTGRNLKRASVQFNQQDNTPEVSLEFDDQGAKLFEQITARNVGKPVAIFLDGYPISVPNVNEKITGGKAVITGNFTTTESKDLVKRLNAGALPVPINLVNQQTIGASLGQASVDNSLKAGFVGLILVALFMIIYYRFLGFLSVIALGVYGILSLAIFKLWPVTLTLSGIAGFILSIGMAVDANILIFERLKEELRAGRSLSSAIQEGFSRAWPSIRDSNFTTLITCVVLIESSTSVIKGFAVTLMLGVLLSLFSAITVTRTFLRLFSEKWFEKHRWLIGYRKSN